MPQPIRVFFSGLTGNIYASRRYTERGNGLFVSQSKDDVTQEAIRAVSEHIVACRSDDCACAVLRVAAFWKRWQQHPLLNEGASTATSGPTA